MIDIMFYNGTNFLRVRNHKSISQYIPSEFQLADSQLKIKLIDDKLALHCLEPKKDVSYSGSSKEIFTHRKLKRFEDLHKESSG
jgi:hypothetical protein